MTRLFDTTIAAIATPPGVGAVAIVRLSGPQSWAIASQLFTAANGKPFQPWKVHYGTLHLPNSNDSDNAPLLDEALVLPFQGPKSFTGEDVVEFHLHGGSFLANTVLEACLRCGAIAAQPGEFTRRAFLHGRVDLSQAESILDLLDARGTAMLDAATRNLREHTLARQIEELTQQLIAIQSQIVASVDFPDEVDEPDRIALIVELSPLKTTLESWLAASERQQWVREGVQIALLGRPNAGKSSLFNRLLAADRAIVTPVAGTTRDTLEDTLHIGGLAVTLVDTAGLRGHTTDAIEQLGMGRSWQAVGMSQGLLYLYNATEGLNTEDETTLTRLATEFPKLPVQTVATHVDQLAVGTTVSPALAISNTTGAGISNLIALLEAWITDIRYGGQAQVAAQQHLCLNQRQRQCIVDGLEATTAVLHGLADPGLPIDLLTVPLTDALRALGAVVGRDTTEEVLTAVFHQFCVGK